MADENTLLLETTQGPVTIQMRPDLAPGHVARIAPCLFERKFWRSIANDSHEEGPCLW